MSTVHGDRPEIIVYDTVVGANGELDVSLAHPFSKDIFTRASREERFAAKREDKEDTEILQSRAPPGLCSPASIPMVFEHFGCWSVTAETYPNQLARRVREEEGRTNEAQFRGHWRKDSQSACRILIPTSF